ncbi:MAG: tRNA glutamyl-Q(34) synthetase GluQRS [SAR324 cluster bacterium]|nr:tRNA glutamyl-Q(34) synthetase GluQRS [SAR324 cluster bacterium]
MVANSKYIGRFAPTPSGELHLGSLVGALGSWLEAKKNAGLWRLRVDDLDKNRVQIGAIDSILTCLPAFGLRWDGEVIYQSARIEIYRKVLGNLLDEGKAYYCTCTKKQIAARVQMGVEGPIYDGHCRNKNHPAGKGSVRLNCEPLQGNLLHEKNAEVNWQDQFLGPQNCDVGAKLGDFVLWRSDDVCSYHLANVVDDHLDNITHVVRGSDLLYSTHRHQFLEYSLGYPHPTYGHLPLVMQPDGKKLSKQTGAQGLNISDPVPEILQALEVLGVTPPARVDRKSNISILNWILG